MILSYKKTKETPFKLVFVAVWRAVVLEPIRQTSF
jgi:hypothetical protein